MSNGRLIMADVGSGFDFPAQVLLFISSCR
jgi:hypothetical protein